MKLLFDENLSRRLCSVLAAEFPGSAHLWDFNLLKADDTTVWEFARAHGYTIVSKDSDFHERSFVYGHPPKAIWLRAGDASTKQIAELLRTNAEAIRNFDNDPASSFLILS